MYRTLEELVAAARAKGPVEIAIAAAHDPDVIEAMKRAGDLGLAKGTFVGDPRRIHARSGGRHALHDPTSDPPPFRGDLGVTALLDRESGP